MEFNLLDPAKASIQTATALGSFVTLLVTRKYGWLYAISLFIVGQITAYYFTVPVAMRLGYGMDSYGAIGFSIGALALLVWGGIIAMAQSFMADPIAVFGRIWRTWKGEKDGDDIPPNA
jgi:Sec-independent protein secretion pathway component TatC